MVVPSFIMNKAIQAVVIVFMAVFIAGVIHYLEGKWFITFLFFFFFGTVWLSTRNRTQSLLLAIVFFIPINPDIAITSLESHMGGASLGLIISLTDVLLLVLLSIVIMRTLLGQSFRFRELKLNYLLLAYIAWGGLSIVWAGNTVASGFEFLRLIKLYLFYLCACNVFDIKRYSSLLGVIFVCVILIQFGLSFYQACTGSVLAPVAYLSEEMAFRSSGWWSGVGGTLGHPAGLALYLILILPFLLGLYSVERRQSLKRVFLFGMLLGLTLVVMTLSRGGAMALLAALAFSLLYLYRSGKIGKRLARRIGIVLILCLVVIGYFFRVELYDRLTGDTSLMYQSRMSLNIEAIKAISRNPICGVGLNNCYDVFYPVKTVVHNIYLLTGVELGIVGLVLFVWVFIRVLLSLYRARKALSPGAFALAIGVFGVIGGVLVDGLASWALLQDAQMWQLWFVFAVYECVLLSPKRANLADVRR